MKEEQIKALAKYLGCECKFTSVGGIKAEWEFDTMLLQMASHELQCGITPKLELYPKPLSSLTQEDFSRMHNDIYDRSISPNNDRFNERGIWVKEAIGDDSCIPYQEADWLRNNGYYLGEESIEQFVKLG